MYRKKGKCRMRNFPGTPPCGAPERAALTMARCLSLSPLTSILYNSFISVALKLLGTTLQSDADMINLKGEAQARTIGGVGEGAEGPSKCPQLTFAPSHVGVTRIARRRLD